MGLLDDWWGWRQGNASSLRDATRAGTDATMTALQGGLLDDAGRAALVNTPAAWLGTDPMGRAGRAAGLLDMAPEARAARAGELGYTVDAYHGSKGDITAFDPARLGQATDAESARNAFFFTNKPSVAATYATGAKDPALGDAARAAAAHYEDVGRRFDGGQAQLDALRERQRDMAPDAFLAAWNEIKAAMPTFDEMQAAQRAKASISGAVDRSAGEMTNAATYPVKLRMQNPLVKDYGGRPYRDETFADVLEQARAAGHDSVEFRNVYDAWKQYGGDKYVSDVYAVFDPAQARSRFAAFDPARAGEADLLAALSPNPLGGLLAPQPDERKR